VIGQGGMATVYLARDLKHGRAVAMKVLRPEVGVLLGRDRFEREIAAMREAASQSAAPPPGARSPPVAGPGRPRDSASAYLVASARGPSSL